MQLHRDRDRFAESGVELALIGNGTLEQAAEFVERHGLDGLRLLVDPERRTYQAAGATVGTLGRLVGPRVFAEGRARGDGGTGSAGAGAPRVIGHVGQLGGVLVVACDGAVAYARLSERSSDIPPNHEVLAAARSVAGSGGAARCGLGALDAQERVAIFTPAPRGGAVR